MVRRFGVVAGALLAALLIGSVVPAAAQTFLLVMDSEPGDYVGGGVLRSYTPADGTFQVVQNAWGGISVHVVGATFWWRVNLSAPGEARITPGLYSSATRYPFSPFIGLAVSGSEGGCNRLTGRYLVREVDYTSGGALVRVAVDIEQHCEDADAALFAVLRFNSTVPADNLLKVEPRYALRVTESSRGVVTGAGIACGGGQVTCATTFDSPSEATLTAIPHSGYIFTGWSGGCSGGATTTINVNSVKMCTPSFDTALPTAPRTLLTMNSEAGDYIGQGEDYVYSSVNSHWTTQVIDDGNWIRLTLDVPKPTYATSWTLEFRALPGEVLQPGVYSNAYRAAFRTTTPGMSIYGDGRGCNTVEGEFVVHQFEYDPTTRTVTAFAADFEQFCEFTGARSLTGSVHYRATYDIVSSCTTSDPFSSLGGGTCYNGGWLPPGMPIPGNSTPPSPPSGPPPSTPPPATAGCATPDPFTALGGGTCYNGGWLPPGMPVPSGGTTSPPPPPPPPPSATGCTSADPFVILGGGTCYNGGWLPPGMPIPGGGGN